jgi:hypothetical protein
MVWLLLALGLSLVCGLRVAQNITVTWASGGDSDSDLMTFDDEGAINYDFTIAGGATDSRKAVVIDVSEVVMLRMVSDRDITIETNSSSAPADTIALVAGKPFLWYSGIGFALADALSADVTDMYFTLAAGADATVSIRGVTNATP